MKTVLRTQGLNRTFGERRALKNISININDGEMVALIGASGSGKSTLLRHVSGLAISDKGTGGRVDVLGSNVQNNGRLAKDIRHSRAKMGFVFQQFNIVNRLSVLDNVLIGLLGRIPRWRGSIKRFTDAEKHEALKALDRVGMAEFVMQRASSLSGGQQQRVAIARTLMQRSEIILADEPIASLDPESSRRVMELLTRINKEDARPVVISLHQVDYAKKYCSRAIALKEGEVFYDGPTSDLDKQFFNQLYGDERVFGVDSLEAEPTELQGGAVVSSAAMTV